VTSVAVSRKRVVLVGVGGHARCVLRALAARLDVEVVCGVDPAIAAGSSRHGLPIVGDDNRLPELRADGIEFFAMGIGGIGDNTSRRESFLRAVRSGLKPLRLVDPTAIVADDTQLADGVFVAPGAVVCPGTSIGANSIVNTRAVIEHDCMIGEHAHVASGAVLCGGVRVLTGAHIGAGAVVRQYLEIGENALVGVGAVVVTDISTGVCVAGNPARQLVSSKK
jgi:sugar O-acyltransferase (sialic acid O-acetyltransferase NeuD family)